MLDRRTFLATGAATALVPLLPPVSVGAAAPADWFVELHATFIARERADRLIRVWTRAPHLACCKRSVAPEDVVGNPRGVSIYKHVDAWWPPDVRPVLSVLWRYRPLLPHVVVTQQQAEALRRRYLDQGAPEGVRFGVSVEIVRRSVA